MINSIPQLTLLEKMGNIRHQLAKQITEQGQLAAFSQAIDELRGLFVDLENLHPHNPNDIPRQLGINDKGRASMYISMTPTICKDTFEMIDALKTIYTPALSTWGELYINSFNVMVLFGTMSEGNPFFKEAKLLLNSLIKKIIIPNLDSFFQKHILPNYQYTFDKDGRPTASLQFGDYENLNMFLSLGTLIHSIDSLISNQSEQIVIQFEKLVVEVQILLLLSDRISNKMRFLLSGQTNPGESHSIYTSIKLFKLITRVKTQLESLNDKLTQLKKEISPKQKNKKSNGKKSKKQKKKNFKQNKNNHPNLTDVSSVNNSDINTGDDDTNNNVEILEQSLSKISVNESSPCLILNTENLQAGFSIPEHKTTEPTLATEVQSSSPTPSTQTLPKNKEFVQLYKNKTSPRNPSSLPKLHTSEYSNRTKKVLQSIFDLDDVKYTHLETFTENLFGEKIKKNKGSKRKINANSHDGKHFKLPFHEKHGHDRKDLVDPQVVRSLRKMLLELGITPDNYLDDKNKTNVKSKNKPKNC